MISSKVLARSLFSSAVLYCHPCPWRARARFGGDPESSPLLLYGTRLESEWLGLPLHDIGAKLYWHFNMNMNDGKLRVRSRS